MALVVAYDDIKPEAVIHNKEGGPDRPAAKVYAFFRAPKDQPDAPSAFLVRSDLRICTVKRRAISVSSATRTSQSSRTSRPWLA